MKKAKVVGFIRLSQQTKSKKPQRIGSFGKKLLKAFALRKQRSQVYRRATYITKVTKQPLF